MDAAMLERKFAQMGARVEVRKNDSPNVTLNIRNDKKGEVFIIAGDDEARVEVLDIQKKDRHLLLFSELLGAKNRFLCGHDERHWFVSAIPDGVVNVRAAKEALQPPRVRSMNMKQKNRFKRRSKDFKRQGEWFFVPEEIDIDPALVLRNELISRGPRATPHIVEEAYRIGGRAVMVSRSGRIVSMQDYSRMTSDEIGPIPWRQRFEGATLYARGKISHPDHATLKLHRWHRVEMNGEPVSQAVQFLD